MRRLMPLVCVSIMMSPSSCLDECSPSWRSRKKEISSQKIHLDYVLLHHALGIEKGAIERDGVAHDTDETLLVAIEQRENDLLEFIVERCGILGPLVLCGQATMIGPDRPSRNPLDTSFNPPAIQHTQRGHPVERRFHSTGARSLQRRLRCVEPDIDAGRQ